MINNMIIIAFIEKANGIALLFYIKLIINKKYESVIQRYAT